MRDSIPGPWDHDLSRRQMPNRLSHPGILLSGYFKRHARKSEAETCGQNPKLGSSSQYPDSGCEQLVRASNAQVATQNSCFPIPCIESSPLIHGDTFLPPQWLTETAHSTKPYLDVLSYTYVPMTQIDL